MGFRPHRSLLLPIGQNPSSRCLRSGRGRPINPPMGSFLVAIAIAIVFVVLCLGLFTLMKGGETGRTWSNKLMRIRVLAQFVAIVIIMVVLYMAQR